jgi:hypothetical protein
MGPSSKMELLRVLNILTSQMKSSGAIRSETFFSCSILEKNKKKRINLSAESDPHRISSGSDFNIMHNSLNRSALPNKRASSECFLSVLATCESELGVNLLATLLYCYVFMINEP